jgi:hypothetical protein
MPVPWNGWYHCNGNTYGTWLRGDARGWRARRHREHVEGDYRNLPPLERDRHLRNYSRAVLKHAPVHLTREQAVTAGDAMVARLLDSRIELLSFALDDHHFHLVARFPDHRPRYYIGLAKQRASYLLVKEFGMEAPIWAKRCRCAPIENRRHQIASVHYDLDHAERGAHFVWCFHKIGKSP